MEEQSTSITIERDNANFGDLKSQILGNKNPTDQAETQKSEPEKQVPQSKRDTFRKGESSFDVDEDAEIEFMADKKPMKLTLRELKDRAAGDIAVKNRMHSLSEEKKRVQSTFKEFTKIAMTDPIGALEYISGKAKEADSNFEYNQYVQKLAEQAENLGNMDEKDRKAWELEKKLSKAEQDLSQKERTTLAVLRKQEMLAQYPEIGDQQFGQMVEAVLGDERLLEGVEDEKGVLDRVESLIQETLTQRDIRTVIEEINPDYLKDDNLIFSLSDQLRQNPDLDEEDVRDIIRELIPTGNKVAKPEISGRHEASIALSQRQRQSVPVEHIKAQGANDYQLLKAKLLERKKEFSKTPLTRR